LRPEFVDLSLTVIENEAQIAIDAKRYGVKAFPTTIIEVSGKRLMVNKASELSEKLR